MKNNPLSGWLDDDEDRRQTASLSEEETPSRRDHSSRSRPGRLLALAAVPWLVVAVMLMLPAFEERPPDVPEPASSPTPQPSPTETTPVLGWAAPEAVPTRAGALAALAVRDAVTRTATKTRSASYVDFVEAETITRSGTHTVVTVLAVVLDGDARGWRTTRTVRYAVPLWEGNRRPVVAGTPWPLPLHMAGDHAPGWRRASLDRAAAAAALEEAGFTEIEGLRLEEDPQAPDLLRARFSGHGANEPTRRDHHVWMSGPPALRVLGLDH